MWDTSIQQQIAPKMWKSGGTRWQGGHKTAEKGRNQWAVFGLFSESLSKSGLRKSHQRRALPWPCFILLCKDVRGEQLSILFFKNPSSNSAAPFIIMLWCFRGGISVYDLWWKEWERLFPLMWSAVHTRERRVTEWYMEEESAGVLRAAALELNAFKTSKLTS